MPAQKTLPFLFKAETFSFPSAIGILFPTVDDGDGLSFHIVDPQEGEEPLAVLKHAFREGWRHHVRTDSKALPGEGQVLFTGEVHRDDRTITFSFPLSEEDAPDTPEEAVEEVAHFLSRLRLPGQ